MQEFIIALLQTVGVQIFSLFGIFFVLGYILTKIQTWTNEQYARSIGWKGILFTAWFGTPIHELGHVIFAKLFRHKIITIELFEPNPNTGGLGHVEHSFHPYSLYQRMGNFFIGAAPMIFGTIVLILMLYIFVPNAKEIFLSLNQTEYTIPTIFSSLAQSLKHFFSPTNLQTGVFYAFLYLSFCVAAHIAPSNQDLKNMWSGFTWMVILLTFVNAVPVFIGVDLNQYIANIYSVIIIIIAMFLYAIMISLVHLSLISLVRLVFKR